MFIKSPLSSSGVSISRRGIRDELHETKVRITLNKSMCDEVIAF